MSRPPKEQGAALTEIIIVVAIMLVVIAMAVPSFVSTRRNYRALGDAQSIAAEILLAKMRASSAFTQARARFNTAANNGYAANSFQIELWDKTGANPACSGTPCWYLDAPSGSMIFSSDVTLGYGAQTNAPPNTQPTISQGNSTAADASCYAAASGSSPGSAITNTVCIVFNSRGIPIDHTGSPTANDAIYITDTKGVYATTISATGQVKAWRIDVNDTTQAHWNQR